MKKTKVFSLLLSIVMLLGLFVPVYAAEGAEVLTVLNGAAGANGLYGSVDIYKTYMNATLTSVDAGTTYAWQPNANGVVESVTKNHSANLITNKALWCPTGWGYEYALSNPELTYTVRFDMKDWYNVERVDVHEINVSDANGIRDISVSVGLNTYSMRAVQTSSSTVLGDSTIFANHANSRANIEVLNTAKRGRYVDVTLTTTGTARVTSIMIFGTKPEKQELNLISGKVINNSERYGSKDVYAQFLDTNLNSLSTAATYTWEPAAIKDAALAYMNDGETWFPSAWNKGEWLTDESKNYVVTYDLKNIFEVTRVDVHEISVNQWNYIDGFSVAVGTSMDNLTPVETTFTRLKPAEVDSEDTNQYRANMAVLNTPTEARYVQVTIDVGSDACIGEVMVFGNSVEKSEVNLISKNQLTDADKSWYLANQKLIVNELAAEVDHQWARYEQSSGYDTDIWISDDDYNRDGIGGEKNITDGNITSSADEFVVPATGASAVIFDFEKPYAISRVDVHEFVNATNGIGTLTVYTGNDIGNMKSEKTVNLTYSTAEELTHQLDSVDLGTPVETRYLAVGFSMDDANAATTNTTGYVLGDVLVFGEEVEQVEYQILKTLSSQDWSDANKAFYRAQGYDLETIVTGADYTWATAEECAQVTTVPTNLTGINDGILNGSNNVVLANNVAAATFDLKAPRTVSRVDAAYNENVWNGFQSMTVYASNDKATLYNEENLVGVLDMSYGEQKSFYPIVPGTSVIAPFTFDAVEAQYIGVVMDNQTGIDSDNDATLRQIAIFGENDKFTELKISIAEAKAYDDSLAYEDADWEVLQAAINEGEALLENTEATKEQIADTKTALDDAIYNMSLRGGQQLISHNSMAETDWKAFLTPRWPEIVQAEFENASARLMTAEDGVTNVDSDITGTDVNELFDGYPFGISGSEGVWSAWGTHGNTYVLYDFGEECYINGADMITYDYQLFNGTSKTFINSINVEVSNDGVNFTPAGSAKAEPIREADLGRKVVRVTSVTFPAKKARYAKVWVDKGAGTNCYVLKELYIRGAKADHNEMLLAKNAEDRVSAKIILDGDEEQARLFVAIYDENDRLVRVEKTEQTDVIDGKGILNINTALEDGQSAKAMLFDSVAGLKPIVDSAVVANYTEADFTVAGIFGNGAVLQRGAELPVFGTATTGTEVTVTLDGKEYTATADGEGKWIAYIDAVVVREEPYAMSVTDGVETYEFSDMLAGDVWLCSGQSNMYYTFDLLGTRKELPDTSDYTNLRYFGIAPEGSETPVNTVEGEWLDVSTLGVETIADMSALSLLSGIEITDYLGKDVPVGVIVAARGGTSIEGFISKEGLLESSAARYWNALDRSLYYNKMIHPIIPYGIKGVLWYQGCQNHGNASDGAYLELEQAWVNDWREKWGDDELAFIITMLAPWSGGNFGHIRDQQLALRDVENDIGVISIMDLGDVEGTIGDNIHPVEKREVARRLALAAAAVAYDDTIVAYRFPVVKSATLQADGSVNVVFDDVYEGLSTKNNEALTGFSLVVNGVERAATANIVSADTVNVSIDGVKNPTAIKYCYKGAPSPELNLFNSAGLSAAGFSMDLNQ